MKILIQLKLNPIRPAVYFVYVDGKKHVLAGGELPLSLLAQAREDGFTGKPGSLATVRHGTRKILLVGLGKKEEADGNTFRLGAAAVVRHSVEAHLPLFSCPFQTPLPRPFFSSAQAR
jgi:hypothetical protein